ncbi:hypothetical protein [Arcobacter cloacae]|uniref:Uncharacterized protein n=1 Tax=Arcobacter cloacae TaxID=1054034 RepID=A0A4Q0ZB63_9BACT|nr:hypothetical protein [Arcobacter cloacae]RXJ83429.1 hypothetical protein CRU90_09430 [Arcobacter cloacae]
MKWWEKTVEYKFIKEYVDINSFIAPLDGNEEKAGDAIFGENENFILIEFKKDKDSIKAEEKKFFDFTLASKTLSKNDEHHILVYGEINNQNLILNAKTYFSEKIIELSKEFSNGKTLKDFKEYLDAFLKYKKGSKVEGGAGSYGLVAGLTQEGSITKCLTLEEFSTEMSLNLNIEKENNIEPYVHFGPGSL